MSDQRPEPGLSISGRDEQSTEPAFNDELAAQRSRIQQMVADPTRDALKTDEIRQLAEDLRERVPAHRQSEFAPFFRGIDDELAGRGPMTGDAGSPSALDTGDTLGPTAPTGGRQP